MISLSAMEQQSAALVSRILGCAEFCGWQEDGKGGHFQLWTLTKPLGGHPAGSTIARSTLEALIRKSAKYGFTTIPDQSANANVESPGKGAL